MKIMKSDWEFGFRNIWVGSFPLIENMIDFEAVKIFKNVIALKINLATSILAETLYSLNHCRKTGKDHQWCLQLLFVWPVS